MRRLVRGYESDADRQRDLLQEMHIELWRSLKGFEHRVRVCAGLHRRHHPVRQRIEVARNSVES